MISCSNSACIISLTLTGNDDHTVCLILPPPFPAIASQHLHQWLVDPDCCHIRQKPVSWNQCLVQTMELVCHRVPGLSVTILYVLHLLQPPNLADGLSMKEPLERHVRWFSILHLIHSIISSMGSNESRGGCWHCLHVETNYTVNKSHTSLCPTGTFSLSFKWFILLLL